MNRPDCCSPSTPEPAPAQRDLLPELNPRLRYDLGLSDARPAHRPAYVAFRGEFEFVWW